ncbi:MAG: hypothetical protein HKP61_13380 [Dactylosporangium sp.]|nr:hypothetical protein [Dactylosporangium sp.]
MIGSVKGSPGVTSLATALVARWPAGGGLVVEADPTGGDLAFRFGHHREPGLSVLVADARGGMLGRDLVDYAQCLVTGVPVVFAPADQCGDGRLDAPGEAAQAVRLLAGSGIGILRAAALSRLVVVDVGRLTWDSPAWPLLGAADVVLLLVAAGLEGLDAVQVRRTRLMAAAGLRRRPVLVLVGQPPCPLGEIARVVGWPVAGVLPVDARGAAVLAGRARPGWGWTRLPLLRSARSLALALQDVPALPPAAAAVVGPASGALPAVAPVPGAPGVPVNARAAGSGARWREVAP